MIIDSYVNSEVYTDKILEESGFLDDAKQVYLNGFEFQRNNARQHVSKYTKKFLEKNKSKCFQIGPHTFQT